jgi:hypothetical protein
MLGGKGESLDSRFKKKVIFQIGGNRDETDIPMEHPADAMSGREGEDGAFARMEGGKGEKSSSQH